MKAKCQIKEYNLNLLSTGEPVVLSKAKAELR
jgi:hypothetical protein